MHSQTTAIYLFMFFILGCFCKSTLEKKECGHHAKEEQEQQHVDCSLCHKEEKRPSASARFKFEVISDLFSSSSSSSSSEEKDNGEDKKASSDEETTGTENPEEEDDDEKTESSSTTAAGTTSDGVSTANTLPDDHDVAQLSPAHRENAESMSGVDSVNETDPAVASASSLAVRSLQQQRAPHFDRIFYNEDTSKTLKNRERRNRHRYLRLDNTQTQNDIGDSRVAMPLLIPLQIVAAAASPAQLDDRFNQEDGTAGSNGECCQFQSPRHMVLPIINESSRKKRI